MYLILALGFGVNGQLSEAVGRSGDMSETGRRLGSASEYAYRIPCWARAIRASGYGPRSRRYGDRLDGDNVASST